MNQYDIDWAAVARYRRRKLTAVKKKVHLGMLLMSLAIIPDTLIFVGSSNAQVLTNNMSCAQTKRIFEQTGRLTTRSRGGKILPIYGGVPSRLSNQLRCGPDSIKAPKFVITKDKRNCAVSYHCH